MIFSLLNIVFAKYLMLWYALEFSLNKKKFPDLKKKISNSESLFINKDQNSNRLRIEHLNMNYIRSKILTFQKLILRQNHARCVSRRFAMVRISDNGPGWNKAKHLSSVNDTTKAIHHYHQTFLYFVI